MKKKKGAARLADMTGWSLDSCREILAQAILGSNKRHLAITNLKRATGLSARMCGIIIAEECSW